MARQNDRTNALPLANSMATPMARQNDRMNALSLANSMAHEIAQQLPGSLPPLTTPNGKQDQGRSALDAEAVESRRLEKPAGVSLLPHKMGTNGGGIVDANAGAKVTITLTGGSPRSSDVRASRQSAIKKRSPAKPAPPADNSHNENAKEKPAVPGTTPTVPRGYFIVERVEMHKIEEGEYRFLIKWEGYTELDNTWEPFDGIKYNTIVKKYMEEEGIQAPQPKKRGRPSLKDHQAQTPTRDEPLATPNTHKRRRSGHDSSTEYAEEATQSVKRGRGRPRKVKALITQSNESSEKGEKEEAIPQAQTQIPAVETPQPKQQAEPRRDSQPQRMTKKTLHTAPPANPSTFVYNFRAEAKQLPPAARSVRRKQLELELAALDAVDQEDEEEREA